MLVLYISVKFKIAQKLLLEKQALERQVVLELILIIDKTKWRNLYKFIRYEKVHNRYNYTVIEQGSEQIHYVPLRI